MFEGDENLKLTYQELKKIEGYENIAEEEAKEVIDVISMVSILAYNIYNKEMKLTKYE